MKVKKAMWFSKNICIVQLSDGKSITDYYIGLSPGPDENDSIEYIKEIWGSRFPNRAGDPLFEMPDGSTAILENMSKLTHEVSDIPVTKSAAKMMIALGQSFLKSYEEAEKNESRN
jgi:hypothetical protein